MNNIIFIYMQTESSNLGQTVKCAQSVEYLELNALGVACMVLLTGYYSYRQMSVVWTVVSITGIITSSRVNA